MSGRYVIAMDGPAGSGKSTVAGMLAKHLNCIHADSGAIYRSLTLAAMQKLGPGASPDEFGKLLENSDFPVEELEVRVTIENGKQVNLIGEEDAGERIRTPEVTSRIRFIADNVGFRNEVNRLLREFSLQTDLVVDGRDIGSVVFPDTPYKFYFEASAEIRAERRMKDFEKQGSTVDLDSLIRDIKKRDEEDMARPFGALKCPEGAIMIDTSGISPNDVLVEILSDLQLQF